MTEKRNRLRKLRLGEISLVDVGADPNAQVAVFKRGEPHSKGDGSMSDLENLTKMMAASTAKINEQAEIIAKMQADIGKLTGERDAAVRDAAIAKAVKSGDDEDAILKAADPVVAAEIIKLRKANAAAQKQLAELADAEETTKFVKMAETDMGSLAVAAKDLGPVLKRATAVLPADDMALLLRVLKASSATVSEALRTVGAGGGLVAKSGAEAELDKIATEISKSENITFAKAYDKALERNPSLYSQFLKERPKTN